MAAVSQLTPSLAHQVTSKDSRSLDAAQMRLDFVKFAEPNSMPIETIRAKKTQGQAFTLACDSSTLEDKEIAAGLDVDAGTFSRYKRGTNTLSNDLQARFCKIVGNTIYPEWIAYQVACQLQRMESDAERELREVKAQLVEEQKLRRHAEDLVTRRTA